LPPAIVVSMIPHVQNQSDPLLSPLKKFFGFSSFRPLQREIMSDSLAGKDVFAVLPTGGGKSLCFQLPALVRPGLTVVVSPLIALMKDQVDALQAAGVAATFLNSSLGTADSRARIRALHNREFRLLYVAPERLMLSGFLEDLKKWDVSLFAIDEAHCISEWGHDFRPEYRQIRTLRGIFPGIPMMALTATATNRVQDDIVEQLHFKNPSRYVASFNRPNLTYRVAAKAGAYEQILSFMRSRPKESGIIYCQARKTADDLAAKLNRDGVSALPYHAGMEGSDRSRHQEKFLRDEVRVVCATIAFGMGINKSNVRFVIHYDLPKNIEGYYQETGRAGRDGLPGECLLLFSAGDRIRQMRFIEEKPNPQEREISRAQLEQMIHYAEIAACRRQFLLGYFGEKIEDANCGGCDNCLAPRAVWDGTVAAQKFLSCVYRIRQKSGFDVGIGHVVEVLCGADTEKIRKFGHEKLTTYNIGTGHSRTEWGAIGRELVRLGFLFQNPEQFNVVQLTDAGRLALTSRQKIMLTKAIAALPVEHRVGEIACDEALFEKLRVLRKRLADERAVPSYIIFSDVTLRQTARLYPANEQELSRVSGFGEKKISEFGEVVLREIAAHLQNNPRQIFADDSFARSGPPATRRALSDTAHETFHLFRGGKSVSEIARIRGITDGTVYGHLENAILAGETIDVNALVSLQAQRDIASTFDRYGFARLAPVVEALDGKYTYGECKIMRAAMQRKLLAF
jgi:ATP-dependent DNA helicase RecQ